MSAAVDVASGALLVAGSAFVLVGGVGLLRFPDFFTRMHAVSVTETAGSNVAPWSRLASTATVLSLPLW